MNTTQMVLEEINVVKLQQPALAQVLAMVIMNHSEVDWKIINTAIRERWRPSARERVLTMAWKIVEDTRKLAIDKN
ncbi:MAG: hypothetical protein NUV80_01985 [Candidatus Berkelbacteria bacterium]|nr:hypothetical protein [Candidatus Berkelbacteria bacterium]